MSTLGVALAPAMPPGEVAARSRRELDRPLAHDAELSVAWLASEAVLLGAFQRAGDVETALPAYRRGSGGGAALVGAGTLWVSLALARVDALEPCAPDKLVNRHVRPLLRALAAAGAHAAYFGRDWVALAHRPVGLVGFAHDADTGRAQLEVLLAVSPPFSPGVRASFRGKEPATLDALARRPLAREPLAGAIAAAYASAYGRTLAPLARSLVAVAQPLAGGEPPWAARVDEPIGSLCAGRDASGRLRLGGELLASRDAVEALESQLAALPRAPSRDELAGAVALSLGAPEVVVLGVSAAAVVEVLARALAVS